MSAHVYPYVFTYKKNIYRTGDHAKTTEKATGIILLESARSRKGDWVIRVKDGWDNPWRTVANISKDFKEFMDKTANEKRTFKNGDHEYEVHREQMGGKLGYSYNTFFWNMMRWALVQALAQFHVHTLEDEIMDFELDKKLEQLPDPSQIEGKERDLSWAVGDEPNLWRFDGMEYHFDYISELERVLKPVGFKILTHF